MEESHILQNLTGLHFIHEMSAFLTKTVQSVDIWKMLKLYSKLQISITNENHLVNNVQEQKKKKKLEQESYSYLLMSDLYVSFIKSMRP